MQITQERVVVLEFKLKDTDGELIEASTAAKPFMYIHGRGQTLPGIEDSLDGKVAGDEVEVTLAAEQAFGARNEELKVVVPREKFEHQEELQIGTQIQVEAPDGTHFARVCEIDGDSITLDANHPLAGKGLHFTAKVVEVREPTEAELEHGHPMP